MDVKMLDNFEILSDQNLFLYAARNYYTPLGIIPEEFDEDMKRFKYIKRLLNRYIEKGELAERLILNHLIIVFNVFGIKPSLRMLEFKLEKEKYWSILKPFLIFLHYIENTEYTHIGPMDKEVIDKLRKI
jgi:hypothetical protein|tara:strand:- start:1240 stop:1629 length:390 start_codon:yes stop_codon:yes gene_type:complete